MSLLEVKSRLFELVSNEAAVLKTALSEGDPVVPTIILAVVASIIIVVLAALLMRSLLGASRKDRNSDESDEPGHLDVLVHDLNTRLLNYITQSREDMSFLKQEVKILRTDVSEMRVINGRLAALGGLDEEVSEIASRLSDFMQLVRDDDIARSAELKEMKSLMLRVLMLEADRGAEKPRMQNSVIKELKAL